MNYIFNNEDIYNNVFVEELKSVFDSINIGSNSTYVLDDPKFDFMSMVTKPKYGWYRLPCDARVVYCNYCCTNNYNAYRISYKSSVDTNGNPSGDTLRCVVTVYWSKGDFRSAQTEKIRVFRRMMRRLRETRPVLHYI